MNSDFIKLIKYDSSYLLEILIDELDLVKTPKISKRIESLLPDINYPSLIILLDRVTYIDSTGISFLVMLNRTISSKGNKMVIVCKRETILEVFDAVQIDNFIKVFPNVDASEKYLNED